MTRRAITTFTDVTDLHRSRDQVEEVKTVRTETSVQICVCVLCVKGNAAGDRLKGLRRMCAVERESGRLCVCVCLFVCLRKNDVGEQVGCLFVCLRGNKVAVYMCVFEGGVL